MSEVDTRTVDDLQAEDEKLRASMENWTRAQLETDVEGGISACRIVDRQMNDLRRQLEDLGQEPCA